MNANVLLDMNSRPVSWAEIQRRNVRWHLLREVEELRYRLARAPRVHTPYVQRLPGPRVSGACGMRTHRNCSGRMAIVPGAFDRHHTMPCACVCHA